MREGKWKKSQIISSLQLFLGLFEQLSPTDPASVLLLMMNVESHWSAPTKAKINDKDSDSSHIPFPIDFSGIFFQLKEKDMLDVIKKAITLCCFYQVPFMNGSKLSTNCVLESICLLACFAFEQCNWNTQKVNGNTTSTWLVQGLEFCSCINIPSPPFLPMPWKWQGEQTRHFLWWQYTE